MEIILGGRGDLVWWMPTNKQQQQTTTLNIYIFQSKKWNKTNNGNKNKKMGFFPPLAI